MRRIFFRFLLLFFFIFVYSGFCTDAHVVDFGGLRWNQLKGRHFIIFYDPQEGDQHARSLLRAAEDYYQEIGETLGFTRYSDFWTWEQRAKIFVFPDQASFIRHTGAPPWSLGYSDRDSYLFKSRAIVTYHQEKPLWKELLPHEISHLILHDFIPTDKLPIWVDEGVAQLLEKDKYVPATQLMKRMLASGNYVRLKFLNTWDVRKEKDPKKVEIFYAQSLSVIRFLREQYGHERFAKFFRHLKNGETIEEALYSAYRPHITSLNDLEDQWVHFILK